MNRGQGDGGPAAVRLARSVGVQGRLADQVVDGIVGIRDHQEGVQAGRQAFGRVLLVVGPVGIADVSQDVFHHLPRRSPPLAHRRQGGEVPRQFGGPAAGGRTPARGHGIGQDGQDLVEGGVARARQSDRLASAGGADAADGAGGDAQKGQVQGRVHGEAQVGHDVAHLAPLGEACRPALLERQTPGQQGGGDGFQYARRAP